MNYKGISDMAELDYEAMQMKITADMWQEDGLTFDEGLESGKSYQVTKGYISDEILAGRLEPIYLPDEDIVKRRQFFALVDDQGNMFNIRTGALIPHSFIGLSKWV